MSVNTNINTKEQTDVKSEIINFAAMSDGLHNENDEEWNTLEAFGESDDDESSYQSQIEINEIATNRIRQFQRQRGKSILNSILRAA